MYNNKTPLVSVIMATFNEPKEYITASISSILNQTYRNLELFVADDSTNEETVCAINAFSEDSRLHIIRQNQRMGFVNALNKALQASKGDFLARMDGDDISLPERLAKQIDFLQEHPKVDVLGGFINIIDKNGNMISERFYPTKPLKTKMWMLFRSPFAHPTVMFRRKVIDRGYFYNPEFKKAEDIELWMRLKNAGFGFGNISEKLLNYRITQDLGTKRSKEQWLYNYRARQHAFSYKSPLFSLLSIFFSRMYMIIPENWIRKAYIIENSKIEKTKFSHK
jgi:glycosyltransferase EpsE